MMVSCWSRHFYVFYELTLIKTDRHCCNLQDTEVRQEVIDGKRMEACVGERVVVFVSVCNGCTEEALGTNKKDRANQSRNRDYGRNCTTSTRKKTAHSYLEFSLQADIWDFDCSFTTIAGGQVVFPLLGCIILFLLLCLLLFFSPWSYKMTSFPYKKQRQAGHGVYI
jgi:hypothetical protein